MSKRLINGLKMTWIPPFLAIICYDSPSNATFRACDTLSTSYCSKINLVYLWMRSSAGHHAAARTCNESSRRHDGWWLWFKCNGIVALWCDARGALRGGMFVSSEEMECTSVQKLQVEWVKEVLHSLYPSRLSLYVKLLLKDRKERWEVEWWHLPSIANTHKTRYYYHEAQSKTTVYHLVGDSPGKSLLSRWSKGCSSRSRRRSGSSKKHFCLELSRKALRG